MTGSGCRRLVLGKLSLAISLFVLNPMVANEAAALGLEMTPSVRVEEGSNSNVFNATDNTVDSMGTRLTPALALKFTTGENSSFQLYGSYEKVWYSSSEAKEAEYSTFNFRLDSPDGVRFTPNWSLNPSVYYINTTNSYRRIQLLPSGDPVLPPVTITNYGDTRTEDFGGAVLIKYRATPNLNVELNGNYSDLGVSGSGDSTRIGGIASVSYEYTPRTTLGIVAAGNRQTYPSVSDSVTLSGGIHLGYLFSPTLRSDLTIGMSYIRQEADDGGTEDSSSDPSGLFSVTYTSETFTLNFYGSALYSGYGYGVPSRQGTVGLILDDKVSRDWSWKVSGSYQISDAVFESTAGYTHAMYGSVGLVYQPWSWGGLDLTGNLNHQVQPGSDLDSYSVILGFTIGKPYIVF